jgi:hypothetical protein
MKKSEAKISSMPIDVWVWPEIRNGRLIWVDSRGQKQGRGGQTSGTQTDNSQAQKRPSNKCDPNIILWKKNSLSLGVENESVGIESK